MSDAELYSKLLSGMRVAEQDIVRSIAQRTGLSNWNSLIGGYCFNAGVIELRRLMSEYLMSQGDGGVVAAFVKAAKAHDVDELRMFIDEDEEVTSDAGDGQALDVDSKRRK